MERIEACENREDSRALFRLGLESMRYGLYEPCIEMLKRYLEMPDAGGGEARSAAMRMIAASYQQKGDLVAAKQWLFRAIAECPWERASYHQLAVCAFLESNWPLLYLMVDKGLSVAQSSRAADLSDPLAWAPNLYDLGALACFRLGMYEKCRTLARAALELCPGDPRLKSNLSLIEAICAGEEAGDGQV